MGKDECMKGDEAWLHDYTAVVVDLWHFAQSRKPKLSLSFIGGGDSRNGVDAVSHAATEFLKCVERAEAVGYWWDGGWIEAVEEFANAVSKRWAKGDDLNTGDIESISAKILKKHMEAPEK